MMMAGDALDRAIARAMNAPSWLGVDDCGIWVADIIREAAAVDPAAELRGEYATELERDALIQHRYGGVLAMMNALMAGVGFEQVRPDSGRRGTVGLVSGGLPIVAIKCNSCFWAVRAPMGIAFMNTPLIGPAWERPGGLFSGD